MKKFTFVIALIFIAGLTFGQGMMYKKDKSIGVRGDAIEYTKELIVIWENDFSEPTEWIEEHSDDPADGPWVIGTDGPTGFYSEGMGPIESTTADNGFAMYDSDANAEAAGMQDATLTYDGTIDCSAYSTVAVQFESYYRMFHGTPYIEISTDGSTWTQFEVHTNLEVNDASENPSLQIVNISEVASNQATVYFRLRYIGEWDYAWMVDDITFFMAPEHDLAMVDGRVNFFFYPHWIDPETYPLADYYGYSGFYGQIPKYQIDGLEDLDIVFDGIVKNFGSIDATPTLTASVTDPLGTEIFTNSATYDGTLGVEGFDTIPVVDMAFVFGNDPALGGYDFIFTASEEGVEDENPSNNEITYTTFLTPATYAHDNDNWTGSWSTENYVDGGADGDVVGVTYPFFVNGDQINHVEVFLSTMTEVGTSFVVKLMEYNDAGDQSNMWTELTSSGLISILDEEDVGMWHIVEMLDPYTVEFDAADGYKELLVAVEYYPDGNSFRFGIDNTTPTNGFETYMYFSNEQLWYYYGGSHVPLIRVNCGPYNDIETSSNMTNNIVVYPNPTSNVVTIDNFENADIQVLSMTGQVVLNVNDVQNRTSLDLSQFAQGTYFIRIIEQGGTTVRKVNLVK